MTAGRAIERVGHDVEVALGPDAVHIGLSVGTNPEISIATTEVTPSVTGTFLHPGETEDQLTSRLASTVQDCLTESRRHVGVAWPPCPHPSHAHPLDPDRSPGRWTCPTTGGPVATIGQL